MSAGRCLKKAQSLPLDIRLLGKDREDEREMDRERVSRKKKKRGDIDKKSKTSPGSGLLNVKLCRCPLKFPFVLTCKEKEGKKYHKKRLESTKAGVATAEQITS